MADLETAGFGATQAPRMPARSGGVTRDSRVRLERRAWDPAFQAALAALALSIVALVAATYGVRAGAGPAGPGVTSAVLTAVLALLAAGAALRSRLSARRRAHEREAFFAESLARLQGPAGFARTLGSVLHDGRQFFRARGVALPAREWATGRALLWAVPAGAAAGTAAQAVELASAAADDWLFDAGSEAWEAERVEGRWQILTLDEAGRVLADAQGVPLAAVGRLASRLGARRLTVAGFGRGSDWGGRLVLVDSESEGPRGEALRFAQRVVRELGGVVQSRFVLGRMRARIGAMERARIARELHDGTIQSLVAVEMEVNVVRRRADQSGLALARDLARVQGLLRSEILELRDTMERLKPIEISPEQLVGFLDTTVARFGRDSGIRAIFDCAVEDVDLAPRVCREIGRIVQEALQNVRKHSHAQEVLVRLGRAPAGWRLVVDDDGQGFPFDGTLSHTELDEGRKGPYVIKERVRALGGAMTIVSSPGGGARLDILLPREAR
jgi:signal transduction histidine kinase